MMAYDPRSDEHCDLPRSAHPLASHRANGYRLIRLDGDSRGLGEHERRHGVPVADGRGGFMAEDGGKMRHLAPIGFGVTIEKEILQRVARAAALPPGGDRAFHDIAGAQRARGTIGFDSL